VAVATGVAGSDAPGDVLEGSMGGSVVRSYNVSPGARRGWKRLALALYLHRAHGPLDRPAALLEGRDASGNT
jgi:hypothetical protein